MHLVFLLFDLPLLGQPFLFFFVLLDFFDSLFLNQLALFLTVMTLFLLDSFIHNGVDP